MYLFGLTLFTSAFLLFLVQPLLGKYILPWFGGTPAVWTTCMLFFQVLLLAGYTYAHFVASRLKVRRQALLHGVFLALSLAALPILPAASRKPAGDAMPMWSILWLLTLGIGAPYLALSATSPLLQHWFSRTRPGASPYRLYSLSNLGSLLAIVAYPVLIEPALPLHRQAGLWSMGYAFFAAASLACGAVVWRSHATSATSDGAGTGGAG